MDNLHIEEVEGKICLTRKEIITRANAVNSELALFSNIVLKAADYCETFYIFVQLFIITILLCIMSFLQVTDSPVLDRLIFASIFIVTGIAMFIRSKKKVGYYLLGAKKAKNLSGKIRLFLSHDCYGSQSIDDLKEKLDALEDRALKIYTKFPLKNKSDLPL